MSRLLIVLAFVATTVGLATFVGRQPAIGPAELYWLMSRACWQGDEIGVRMLLKAGADPNGVRDYEAFYKSSYNGGFEPSWPINEAAYGGHASVVELLLKAGAKPDLPEHMGETALIIASSHGHLEVVRMLLEAGADKNAKRPDDRGADGTAEEVARFHNHLDIADMIHKYPGK